MEILVFNAVDGSGGGAPRSWSENAKSTKIVAGELDPCEAAGD
jgi:hypothetical protein